MKITQKHNVIAVMTVMMSALLTTYSCSSDDDEPEPVYPKVSDSKYYMDPEWDESIILGFYRNMNLPVLLFFFFVFRNEQEFIPFLKFGLSVRDNKFIPAFYQHHQGAFGQVDMSQAVAFRQHFLRKG